jgi:lysyl-tRNA synthetase class II
LKGRILTKREASKKLTFYTVRSGNATVQVMSSQSDYPDADNHSYINKNLRRGDIIGTHPSTSANSKLLQLLPKTLMRGIL